MMMRDQFSLSYRLNQDTGENHPPTCRLENVHMSQLARDHLTYRINAGMVIQVRCVQSVKMDTPQPTRIRNVNDVSRAGMQLDLQL